MAVRPGLIGLTGSLANVDLKCAVYCLPPKFFSPASVLYLPLLLSSWFACEDAKLAQILGRLDLSLVIAKSRQNGGRGENG